MKRFLAVLAGGLGLGALLRRRRRRSPELESSPAEELRVRLAEAEAREEQKPSEAAPEAPDDVAARRRDVHERGRQALDDLG